MPQTFDYTASGRRQMAQDDATARAHDGLRTDMRDALLQDPSRLIWTPMFRGIAENMPAMRAVYELLPAASGSEVTMAGLLELVRVAAIGEPSMHVAQLLVETISRMHADYHIDAAMEGSEGDDSGDDLRDAFRREDRREAAMFGGAV